MKPPTTVRPAAFERERGRNGPVRWGRGDGGTKEGEDREIGAGRPRVAVLGGGRNPEADRDTGGRPNERGSEGCAGDFLIRAVGRNVGETAARAARVYCSLWPGVPIWASTRMQSWPRTSRHLVRQTDGRWMGVGARSYALARYVIRASAHYLASIDDDDLIRSSEYA